MLDYKWKNRVPGLLGFTTGQERNTLLNHLKKMWYKRQTQEMGIWFSLLGSWKAPEREMLVNFRIGKALPNPGRGRGGLYLQRSNKHEL